MGIEVNCKHIPEDKTDLQTVENEGIVENHRVGKELNQNQDKGEMESKSGNENGISESESGLNPGSSSGGQLVAGSGFNPGYSNGGDIVAGSGFNPGSPSDGQIIAGSGFNPGSSSSGSDIVAGSGFNPGYSNGGDIVAGSGFNPGSSSGGQIVAGSGFNPGSSSGGQVVAGSGFNPGYTGGGSIVAGSGFNPGSSSGQSGAGRPSGTGSHPGSNRPSSRRRNAFKTPIVFAKEDEYNDAIQKETKQSQTPTRNNLIGSPDPAFHQLTPLNQRAIYNPVMQTNNPGFVPFQTPTDPRFFHVPGQEGNLLLNPIQNRLAQPVLYQQTRPYIDEQRAYYPGGSIQPHQQSSPVILGQSFLNGQQYLILAQPLGADQQNQQGTQTDEQMFMTHFEHGGIISEGTQERAATRQNPESGFNPGRAETRPSFPPGFNSGRDLTRGFVPAKSTDHGVPDLSWNFQGSAPKTLIYIA